MLKGFDQLLGQELSALRGSTGPGDEIVLGGANLPAHEARPVIAASGRLLRGNLLPRRGVIRPDRVAR